MNELDYMRTRSQEAVVSTNKVLRNTYWLLSMTLLFSAVTAGIAMAVGIGQGTALILMLVSFGLLFWFSVPLLKRSIICLIGVIPAIGSFENGKLKAMAPTILLSI